jgi:hypothetical protein
MHYANWQYLSAKWMVSSANQTGLKRGHLKWLFGRSSENNRNSGHVQPQFGLFDKRFKP